MDSGSPLGRGFLVGYRTTTRFFDQPWFWTQIAAAGALAMWRKHGEDSFDGAWFDLSDALDPEA
jgi:hypothetical protein